jgi:sarcosine oxidase
VPSFDVIVLGCGGVGSSAAYHAASRDARVLALDQFPTAHDRGSSHGETRLIRKAYWEHPDYVPLLHHAYESWAGLERVSGTKLFFPTGLLQIGSTDGSLVSGVLASAKQHNLPVETLSASEITRRFPGFHVPEGMVGVFESQAGVLLVEKCIEAYHRASDLLGVTFSLDSAVERVELHRRSVTVHTTTRVYTAGKLIVAAGAWAGRVLPELAPALTVLRKPVYWFNDDSGGYSRESGCPGYLYQLPHGEFYGIPQFTASIGVKVAEHTGGESVADPLNVDRTDRLADRERILEFAHRHLPGLSPRMNRFNVCMYTMSPDGHFIVDRHPEFENVAFAAGLSGHGFKLTNVLGEALVELVLNGRRPLPIEFLGVRRPAVWNKTTFSR